MAQERNVYSKNKEIQYLLERKPVKNLNLRIRKDGKVYVSAHPDVPAEKVDDFVVRKGAYIRSAQQKFREMAQYATQPKQYVSGETFYLLGKGVRLKVEKHAQDSIFSDGVYLYLCMKDPDDVAKWCFAIWMRSAEPFLGRLFQKSIRYSKNTACRCRHYIFGIWKRDGAPAWRKKGLSP